MAIKERRDEAKKQFDYMMCDVLKERKKHMLASLHYNEWGGLVFVISAIITLVQALLASLAQAEAERLKRHQSSFTLTISFLAAFSVFWQSLLKNWNYNGKATLHDSAAAALGKIYKTASLKARELRAKNSASAGNESTTGNSRNIDNGDMSEKDEVNETSNMLHSLVKQFEQATESCTSLVPAKINAAFELLDNKIEICKRKVYTPGKKDERDGTSIKIEWDSVYSALYRELSAVIIKQNGWPYRIPDPETVVCLALKNYEIKEVKDNLLLDTVLRRNAIINMRYDRYEDKNYIGDVDATTKDVHSKSRHEKDGNEISREYDHIHERMDTQTVKEMTQTT